MTGTARYASLNAHKGNEQSRRDDLEAVGFMLCYFLLKGSLPWQGLKVKKSERAEMLIKIKQETTFEQLLEGQPIEFIDYMNYVRNLAFDQRPDYSYIKKLFEGMMLKNGWDVDY